MWICLNNGFLSAVEDTKDNQYLYVRARNIDHLKDNFPDNKIIFLEERDYAYRIHITKKDFADMISSKITNIDYPNFKDSVNDESLYTAYSNMWYVMFMYQAGYYDDMG